MWLVRQSKGVISAVLCPSCCRQVIQRTGYRFLHSNAIPQGQEFDNADTTTKEVQDDENKGPETNFNKHIYQSIFPWKSRQEFHNYLLQQIVHNDDGLVVISKPFGVGVTSKINVRSMPFQNLHLRGIGSVNYSLEASVPFFRAALNKPELVLVKSTEKMTSGIAVYADDAKHAEKFKYKLIVSKGLSHSNPLYNYRVITTAIPYTKETTFHERVGLHLVSTPLSDYRQPTIERKIGKVKVQKDDMRPVWVKTTVLRSSNESKTALLEIQTSTIKWNFLRVYCADLLVPILGDNLYSCRVKTIMGVPAKMDMAHAPPGSSDQILSSDVLNALNVKGSINVPPHIHLYSYSLHNYKGKGQHLVLTSPVPNYFKWSQERLQLWHD